MDIKRVRVKIKKKKKTELCCPYHMCCPYHKVPHVLPLPFMLPLTKVPLWRFFRGEGKRSRYTFI